MAGGMVRGECLCRVFGYEVPDAFAYAVNCHCSQCRRRTGAAFKPLAGIAASALRVTRGAEAISRFGEGSDHDAFCGRCGSLVYSLVRGGSFAHLPLGTMIDTPSLLPSAHIYVGSKAPWHVICDGLPQYDQLPPG